MPSVFGMVSRIVQEKMSSGGLGLDEAGSVTTVLALQKHSEMSVLSGVSLFHSMLKTKSKMAIFRTPSPHDC